MNSDLFLRHFETISEGPDAIPRLRLFVLDLAVRGKLVEQSQSDEPASELLKRIQGEKLLLVRDGKISKQHPVPQIGAAELPFLAPTGWSWSRLSAISHRIHYGYTASANALLKDVRLLRITDIQNNVVDWSSVPGCEISKHEIEQYKLHQGDILIARTGGTIGKTFLVNQITLTAVFASYLIRVRTSPEFCDRYLKLFLESPVYWTQLQQGARGGGQPNVNGQTLGKMVVAVPPLAEQHRIVAKVDELMTLCDRLEAKQRDREATRDRLSAASMYHLNTAANTEAFRRHADFYLCHLPSFTTRSDQIRHLREAILNLAIRGQLVCQEAEDQPVSELLTCIMAENARLQKAKNIRAQKSVPPAQSFEGETSLPKTWAHAYLQDLAYQITDGTHLTPTYTEKGKPFLSAQNVKPFRFMPEKHRFVSDVDFENYRANRRPERGDVLLTRVGAGIGEAAVLDSDFEFAFYVSLCLIKIPTKFLNPRYLVLWLNSPEGRESSTVRTYGKGASQGNLNLGLIRTFKIPIPPLAEQNRIVAKVDELMTLCHRLEAQLATAGECRLSLLNSVLHHALAPITNDC